MVRNLLTFLAVLTPALAFGQPPAAGPMTARIVVELPADARLSFDGHPTRQTGAMRTFLSPPLAPGKTYHYEIVAEVLRDGQTKMHKQRIAVRVGETTRVRLGDFTAAEMRLGRVYTLDNDPAENRLLVFERGPDGSLSPTPGSPYPTGGKGLAGGDIDEQGAVRVHGGFVLAVNPGSDSIAVFKKEADGRLTAVPGSPFPSLGDTPLSLTAHGDLVYVANQAAPFAGPAGEPNLVGFRIDEKGRLMPIPGAIVTFPRGQGPAQVDFSPSGKTVAVTAGFQAEDTSRIYSYRVMPDGTLGQGPGSPLKPTGASGVVGFSWGREGKYLYVSNFRGSAVTVFRIGEATGAVEQVGGAYGDEEEAACWTALSPDGKTLYVGNFVSNSISVFDVLPEGKLKLLGTTKRRGAANPDTKDIEVSRDGKHLYAVGSGKREIATFRIGADRLPVELSEARSPMKLVTGQNTTGLATD